MTPKNKAKELVDKFLTEVFSGEFQPTSFSMECAKACAIICVDEIINVTGTHLRGNPIYWLEVKQAIQKL